MLQLDGWLTIYLTVLAGVLGTVFGSFFNCMAWRLAHRESVLSGRSHCTACGHVLGALDLVPVFSWIFLRGRCRYCGEKLSPRYLCTELLLGTAFVCLLYRYDISWELLRALLFVSALFVLSLVDLEIFEIPDRFHVFMIAVWILFLPFSKNLSHQVISGLLGAFLISGSMLLLSIVYDRLKGMETFGGGDVKLLFCTGLYLGLAGNFLNLILSCLIGILFAAVTTGKRKERENPAVIPFGPSIAMGSFVCLMAGEPMIRWYLGLF